MNPTGIFQTILNCALPVVFAIAVHEKSSRGCITRALGDGTAAMVGRAPASC